MRQYSRYVGLDTHKDTIAIAVAEKGREDALYLGRIVNEEAAIGRWLGRQRERWGTLDDVLMCYEAGPCGYGLYRYLKERGQECLVVAPGLTPHKPNERIKTDRRDAQKLAKYLRAGELTTIWVPDEEHEAFRRLLRLRAKSVTDRTRARHQLSKFLLSQSRRVPQGINNWTTRHERWLDTLRWENANDALVFIELRHHIREGTDRLERLEQAISGAVQTSPLEKGIKALQCLKGFQEITAATVCAELGEGARFSTPRELMSYTGLVPGIESSGNQCKHFSITKVGNSHLRRVLIEAAWSYRHPPRVGPSLRRRQTGQPAEVVRVSWKAQTRLNGRYRRLVGRGKETNKVITAIARELVGFAWEVLRILPPIAPQPIA